MTKSQKISLILFILSFASIEIASVLIVVIGRFWAVSILGYLKYSWIFFLFLPIPLVSLMFGLISLTRFDKYRKNILASSLIIPFMIVAGCDRFFFRDITDFSDYKIRKTAKNLNIELPNIKTDCYSLKSGEEWQIYAFIDKKSDQKLFFDYVSNSDVWVSESSQGKQYLPTEAKKQTEKDYDYRCYCYAPYYYGYRPSDVRYNDDTFNHSEFILTFFAYSSSLNRLYVLSGYTVISS